jgi:hypothetical protein
MTVERALFLPGITKAKLEKLEEFLELAQHNNEFNAVSTSFKGDGFYAHLFLEREIREDEMEFCCEVCGIRTGAFYTIH